MKKVLGVLFFAMALFSIIGAIGNGTLFNDYGSAAQTYGVFLGQIIGWFGFIGAGIFFLVLDRSNSIPLLKGYRTRRKLATWSIIFMIYFVLLFALSYMQSLSISVFAESLLEAYLYILKAAGLPFLCFVVFVFAFSYYFLPLLSCKSIEVESFLKDDEFKQIGSSSSIFASNKAILFKKLLIVVPFAQIVELRKKDVKLFGMVLESNIMIKLHNGKKITITSKEYDTLNDYINNRNRV